TQSLEQYRELNDREGVAFVLNALGDLARWTGRHKEAQERFEAALLLAKEIGSKIITAHAMTNIGRASSLEADYTRAAGFLLDALRLYGQSGAKVGIASCLMHIALLFNT